MVFATWDASFIYFLGKHSCLWRNREGGEALGSYYCHQCNFHKGKLMKLGGKTDLHKCKTKIVENSPLPLIHFPGKGEGKMRKEYANEI